MKKDYIKRKAGNLMATVMITFVLFSCISTQNLMVEIPTPASRDLPSSIQSLTIVTGTADENYADLEVDSLQKIFFEHRFDYDTVIFDRQMMDTTLQAIGELLFESGRYDYVIPRERYYAPRVRTSYDEALPWDTIKKLASVFETDAVLSLDHIKTRVVTRYDIESFYDPYADRYYDAALANMKIYYEALFRVYDPEREKVVLREFMRDTLVWEEVDVSARALFREFTPVKQALTETGISLALDLSEKISVIWRTEQRTFFAGGNKTMEQAARLARTGNWEAAVSLWEEIANSTGSKSLKSKAQLNIALGYEMLGNVDEAISRALESYNTMYRPLTYEYLQTLKRRKNELKNP